MIAVGAEAPGLDLAEIRAGGRVRDPWTEGPVVLAFFKTTCPVCRMSAPAVQALADGGARVVAVGQDPPDELVRYSDDLCPRVTTVSEPAPYEVSDAFGLSVVPTFVLVDGAGRVADVAPSWDRDAFNRLAAAVGVAPVSQEGDGLPSFRPG